MIRSQLDWNCLWSIKGLDRDLRLCTLDIQCTQQLATRSTIDCHALDGIEWISS